MYYLYSYNLDCGRMGEVCGLFVADPFEVETRLGREIYFGEILGKHSEVVAVLSEDHLKVISDDQEKIKWLVDVVGSSTISGYNPLHYIEDYDEY